MKPKDKKTENLPKEKDQKRTTHSKTQKEKKSFPGYPHYPASEDIYDQEKEVDLDPDDLSENKKSNKKPGKRNEKDFREDMTGEDLDVPGSKADEAKGKPGSEDEENNYYSLGGDNHDDLEEDDG